jgi:hypothetical protein
VILVVSVVPHVGTGVPHVDKAILMQPMPPCLLGPCSFQEILSEVGFDGGRPIDEAFFRARISGRWVDGSRAAAKGGEAQPHTGGEGGAAAGWERPLARGGTFRAPTSPNTCASAPSGAQ